MTPFYGLPNVMLRKGLPETLCLRGKVSGYREHWLI